MSSSVERGSPQQVFLHLSQVEPQFDIPAFDAAIESHGVRLVHWRSFPCPVGIIDQYDQRQPHEDHEGCSNGRIYVKAGIVKGLLTNNSKDPRFRDVGALDSGIAQLTVPRNYIDNDDEVQVMYADRLLLDSEDIVVPQHELFKVSVTGRNRLLHPAVKITDMVDSRGVRYQQDVDFTVSNGVIIWSNAPVSNALQQPICSVRYTFKPYWYVDRLLHELRLGQADSVDGLKTVKLPQAMIVIREHVFLGSQKNDPGALGGDLARQEKTPQEGDGSA